MGDVEETDDGLIVCHICGETFGALAPHISAAHDVLTPEYRALFGLKRKRSLAGRQSRELRRAATLRRFALEPDLRDRFMQAGRTWNEQWTPEQRSATFSGRAIRPEAKRTHTNNAAAHVKTHCLHGHDLTLPDSRINRKDGRLGGCRECARLRQVPINAKRATLRSERRQAGHLSGQ
jgi:hypothetical protein